MGAQPVRARTLSTPSARGSSPAWTRRDLSGLLTELSAVGGAAALTLAFSLVLDAQKQGETVAWVTDSDSIFFPPDAAAGGVDLAALAVVRVPGVRAILKAADRLVRSGAFGLVVLDLGGDLRVPLPVVARLAGLARKHDAAIVCLTEKGPREPSLGSMVAVRGEARRRRTDDGRYACGVEVLKDKRGIPGWTHTEICSPPEGLD